MVDKEWLRNNIEVVDARHGYAEVVVPYVKRFKIQYDSEGYFIVVRGVKIYSRYLEEN